LWGLPSLPPSTKKKTYAARINVCFIEIDVLHSSLISITCPGKPELYKIGKTKRKKRPKASKDQDINNPGISEIMPTRHPETQKP
jgi:hypothetical protein